MSDDVDGFDAAAAAARASGEESTGDSGDAVAPDHADAEGSPEESNIGNTSRWREMLMSSEPDPPLSAVESPWNPDEGGPTRIMRAVKKMMGMDGLPAWADMMLAVPETWIQMKENLDNVGSDQDKSDDQEPIP